jgi:peptidoglycan/LPS O-acetylase OafA/YrhL
MLPFDRKPWAKAVAKAVIVFTLVAAAVYIYMVKRTRSLDWGERAIVVLALLAVIPPNVAIIQRKDGMASST